MCERKAWSQRCRGQCVEWKVYTTHLLKHGQLFRRMTIYACEVKYVAQ
jgi:hypothetical protein